jgi:23S rRNA (adenine2030-N6)-methyltransferase
MNYRHAFHAGNHADVLKHAALAVLLNHMKAKEKAVFALDTHAGRGSYDLTSTEAMRSGESRHGVARVIDDPARPAALEPYIDALRAANAGGGFEVYPGSPVIIAAALRAQDRLTACELNPRESSALAEALYPYVRARAETRDGYAAVKALLPPPERRGLVLIDPPFEKPDEFEAMGQAIIQGWKRFPTGVFLAWYPLKDGAAAAAFHARIAGAGIGDVTTYELFVRSPEGPAGMAGSGLLSINASYPLDAAMGSILPYLTVRLAQGAGAAWRMERLTAE